MKIYVDFDCVLVNTNDVWLNWVNSKYDKNYVLSDIKYYHFIIDQIGIEVLDWWFNPDNYINDYISPFPGAENFIRDLQNEYGKDNIFIATHSHPNIINSKEKYISEIFNINKKNIIQTPDKWNYTDDGILIDDFIRNILIHKAINKKPGILFNYDGKYLWADKQIQSNLIENNPLYAEKYSEVITLLKGIYGKCNS